MDLVLTRKGGGGRAAAIMALPSSGMAYQASQCRVTEVAEL